MKNLLRDPALLRAFACAFVLFVLSGCNAVWVAQPLGARARVLKPEDWNGVWQSQQDNSCVTVHVTDAAKGEFVAATVETDKDRNALVLKSETIAVRDGGKWMYLQVSDPHEGKDRFSWAPARRDEEVLCIWLPSVITCRALVQSGKLKGEVTSSGDVVLESLSAETLTAMTTGDLHAALEWGSPLVLRRIKR